MSNKVSIIHYDPDKTRKSLNDKLDKGNNIYVNHKERLLLDDLLNNNNCFYPNGEFVKIKVNVNKIPEKWGYCHLMDNAWCNLHGCSPTKCVCPEDCPMWQAARNIREGGNQ